MDIKKVNVIKSKLSGGEGYDHFSPTQLTLPIAKYIFERKEDGTFGKQINEYTRDIKQRTK